MVGFNPQRRGTRCSSVRRALLGSTILLGLAAASPALAQDADEQPAGRSDSDIVVTATRSSQSLSKVPLAVEAFSNERLDQQGIRNFADLAVATPGLNFSKDIYGANAISVRGISSPVGAATTAIYIDDTPIQMRTLGFASAVFVPAIFDLERVEVLKGPQGTLFGDSAQGGAVRFITPTPNLSQYSGYARTEISTTDQGSESYEIGLALGGPIISDALAFRASGYFRRDGGWIDRVIGDFQVRDKTGVLGPKDSLAFAPTGIGRADANWSETSSARMALRWQPTPGLDITPSIHYEQRTIGDQDLIWTATSDISRGDFSQPLFTATVDDKHTPLPGAPKATGGKDRFILPSLNIDWETGPVRIVSTTSYLTRKNDSNTDYTVNYMSLFTTYAVPAPGDYAYGLFKNKQKIFTQELRAQSADSDTPLRWVVGAFYSHNDQRALQWNRPNFVAGLDTLRTATTDGAPFGPGYSAFTNFYGDVQRPDGTTYYADLFTRTKQFSVFGQVDYKITEQLTATVGLRWADSTINFVSSYYGPNTNLNQPQGRPCEPRTGVPGGAPCVPVVVGEYAPGEGPFAIAYPGGVARSREKPLTPKFGLSFQADSNNLFYANIAKGYRTGGAQARVAQTCRDQLIGLGYTDGQSPETYKSDTVWSYEAGAKSSLFDGRLHVDASVYQIRWSNVQTNVGLSSCGLSFVTNGTGAKSTGFDLQLGIEPVDALNLTVTVGYKNAILTDDVQLNNVIINPKGATIPGSGAPWNVAVNAQYEVPISGSADAYIRGDYMYDSRFGRFGQTNPLSSSYDPMLEPTGATNLVNARIGVRFSEIDLSLFANNMFNSHPEIGLNRIRGQAIYTINSFRPRTVGLQASYRF